MEIQNRFTKKIRHLIEYHEFDQLVMDVYGVRIESALDQSNYSCISVDVDGKMNDSDESRLNEFFSTGLQKYDTVRLIFQDMCRKGLLEPGKYLIEVYW